MFPKLFEIGGFPIHTYGVLLALALLASIELMARLASRQGVDRNRVWDFGFVIVLSALVGAKLLLIVTEFKAYSEQPSRIFTLEFLQAAGVYYGGLLGAIVGAFWFFSKHRELNFWTFADLSAPCIALGQFIGRLGCFAAGCDYGKPTDLPWAVTFTDPYAARNVGVPLNVALHPSQLYESFAALVLFGLLFWALRSKKFPGQVFLLYLMGYSVVRFFLEFYRGDPERGLYFGGAISTSQIVSLLLFPIAALIYWRRRQARVGTSRG